MRLIGPDQVSHPKECPEREIRCPVSLCKEKVPLSKVLAHVFDDKHMKIFDLSDRAEREQKGRKCLKVSFTTFIFNWAIRPIHMTLGTGEDFFLESARENEQWIFWVVHVGSVQECRKFEAEITIEKGDQNQGDYFSLMLYRLTNSISIARMMSSVLV